MTRATQLDVDEVRRLDHFVTSLDVMFPTAVGICHVGSSLVRADYRDVDVRVVLSNDDFGALTDHVNLLDLNMLLSGWGRQVTGLRIDCQVQSFAESRSHDDDPRHGVGMMARYRRPLDKILAERGDE